MSPTIETGRIKRKKNTHSQEDVYYEIRFLDETYLNEIIYLQETIIHNLPDKEIFRQHSINYIRDHFNKENSVIGIVTEDGLIAYNILYFPGIDGDNFGADIKLSKEELNKVAHIETVAVHPDYRGNSLQKRMEEIHLKVIKELGYIHVCCTVSPKNLPSIRNLFSNGLIIKGIKIKFGDRLRYIMHRDILNPIAIGPDEIRVSSLNIEYQRDLLNRGFFGYRIIELLDGFGICYGKEQVSEL